MYDVFNKLNPKLTVTVTHSDM